MSSGSSSLLPVIIVAVSSLVAGSSLGAVISTYGGKARDRSTARAECLAALRAAESGRYTHIASGRGYDEEAVAQLEVRCRAARVPQRLPKLYASASKRWKGQKVPMVLDPASMPQLAEYTVAELSMERAAELLAGYLWRPWLSWPLRRHRMRRLEKMIDQVSGQPERILDAEGAWRIWRVAAGRTTRRDRAIGSLRERLDIEDPLIKQMKRSRVSPGNSDRILVFQSGLSPTAPEPPAAAATPE